MKMSRRSVTVCSSAAMSCAFLAANAIAPMVAQAQPPVVSSTSATKTFNHDLDADLRAAVKANDVKRVRKLLSRGADPNTKDSDETSTPLLAYINDTSNLDITRALVEAGADLEAGNTQGNAPLIFAALHGRLDIIKYLLQRGANIEGNKFDGLTALMIAATAGQTETVRVLMAAGANVNARSTTNGTALIYGSAKTIAGTGNLETIKMLVNAGADVSVKAANGKGAIATADENGLTDIAAYLRTIYNRDLALFNATAKAFRERETADSSTRIANWKAVQDALAAGANPRFSASGNRTALLFLTYSLPNADDATVNSILTRSDLNVQEDEFGDTPLHSAAERDNAKIVAGLIKAGANLNILDKNNQTPLDLALEYKCQNVIPLLQKAGAGENSLFVDDLGHTKLMLLAQTKPFDSTKAAMFLKAGVDVNATNKRIDTALMIACDSSSPEAVKFLIKNGANVNFVDIDGGTALMYGAQLKSSDDALDIVQQLIAAKADVNAKSHKGNTALSLANANSNLRAYAELVKAGAKDVSKTDSTPSTADANSTDTKNALATTPIGDTTLMLMAGKKPFDATKAAALLKAGVNINDANIGGWTALSNACHVGSPDAVRFLLKNGADVNYAQDFFGKGDTALMESAKLPDSDAVLDIVQQLIAAGADINAKGLGGKTALDYARASSNQRVVDVLLKAGAKDDASSKTIDEDLLLDKDGNTKLMLLVWTKTFDRARAEVLIKKGVDVNAKDKVSGYTALINAAYMCTPEAVSFLLKSGAKINIANSGGWTPLIAAAERSDHDEALAVVKILIAAGADLNLKNNKGDTALMVARSSNNSQAADALIKAGAK